MYEYNLAIRFQRVSREHAARTAIWNSNDDQITYGELNKLANRIARQFIAPGSKAGDVIAISGEKSFETFACMLASLKLGCPYVMLDPDSPVERLRKILTTCKPALLVAHADLIPRLERITNTVNKDDIAAADSDDTDLFATEQITGATPAYIMFTSGSTGFPKGAVMTHANVLNLINWSRETFSITVDDRLSNVNPLYFDNSVFDFYSALFNGATLVPLSKAEVSDPGLLARKVDAAKCTLWFSVPSLLMFLQTMKVTDGERLKSIQRFIFGGEGYPKAKLKSLFDAYSAGSRFFNVYGPTECTCICSSYEVTEVDFTDLHGLPALGQIANNFKYLILDESDRAVAEGETGELCLLGPNVGLGYYNDPKRTAESFVQNPRNDKFMEIMYRTGDLVRLYPADNKLYIEGRKDNQIKHMGYRIELEEIEAALHSLDYVSEAAALHHTVNGISRIVSVVASEQEFSDESIRGDLKQIVPAYMVPAVFYRERVLPKNANGKVDRRALAEKYCH